MTRRFAFAQRQAAFDQPWWAVHRSRHPTPGAAFEAAVAWRTDIARHGIPLDIRIGEVIGQGREARFEPIETPAEAA